MVVKQTGGADMLSVSQIETPSQLKAGEVLVRNIHAGVNFIDTYVNPARGLSMAHQKNEQTYFQSFDQSTFWTVLGANCTLRPRCQV